MFLHFFLNIEVGITQQKSCVLWLVHNLSQALFFLPRKSYLLSYWHQSISSADLPRIYKLVVLIDFLASQVESRILKVSTWWLDLLQSRSLIKPAETHYQAWSRTLCGKWCGLQFQKYVHQHVCPGNTAAYSSVDSPVGTAGFTARWLSWTIQSK